jgi:hypothetical protein
MQTAGPRLRIFVDADACPVKDEVYRVAARYGLTVFVVANSPIMVPRAPEIERIVVGAGPDAADDWIAERAGAVAGALRTTRDEIAQTAGLGRDAILRKERVASQKTQKRLREMVEILNKIGPRFGSDLIGYAWYRSEPLPGFSGQTAMQLVRAGRAADVLEYVDAVDAGVFA